LEASEESQCTGAFAGAVQGVQGATEGERESSPRGGSNRGHGGAHVAPDEEGVRDFGGGRGDGGTGEFGGEPYPTHGGGGTKGI